MNCFAPLTYNNLSQMQPAMLDSPGKQYQAGTYGCMLIQPQKFDVLCGKDKLCVNHFGSKNFRKVIEAYKGRYAMALTKFDKMAITKEIYEGLYSASGRFLKFSDSDQQWEELSAMAARDKIGHSLRFANRTPKARKTKKAVSSSDCSVASSASSVSSKNSSDSVTSKDTATTVGTYVSYSSSGSSAEESAEHSDLIFSSELEPTPLHILQSKSSTIGNLPVEILTEVFCYKAEEQHQQQQCNNLSKFSVPSSSETLAKALAKMNEDFTNNNAYLFSQKQGNEEDNLDDDLLFLLNDSIIEFGFGS